MVCKYDGKTKPLSLKTMEEVLNMLLIDYIS